MQKIDGNKNKSLLHTERVQRPKEIDKKKEKVSAIDHELGAKKRRSPVIWDVLVYSSVFISSSSMRCDGIIIRRSIIGDVRKAVLKSYVTRVTLCEE